MSHSILRWIAILSIAALFSILEGEGAPIEVRDVKEKDSKDGGISRGVGEEGAIFADFKQLQPCLEKLNLNLNDESLWRNDEIKEPHGHSAHHNIKDDEMNNQNMDKYKLLTDGFNYMGKRILVSKPKNHRRVMWHSPGRYGK